MVYSSPFFPFCLCKKRLNGREKELGIWPEDSPGLGSGSFPVNLWGTD